MRTAGSAAQNTGDITLAFTVDGAGNVTLDASCADPDPVTYVDEFDGSVGTVSDPAMWGQSFSIELSESGSGNLRIDNTGSGLASQGGNAQIIDANANGSNETITATVTAPGADFLLQSVNYAGRLGGAGMTVSDSNYTISGASGTVDTSAQGINGTFTVATDSTSHWFRLHSSAASPLTWSPQPQRGSLSTSAIAMAPPVLHRALGTSRSPSRLMVLAM